jgi:hypothetical protein
MRRVGFLVCAAIVVIQLGLLGYAVSRASTPTRLAAPIRPTTEPQFPLDLEGIWPFASNVATGWKHAARLAGRSRKPSVRATPNWRLDFYDLSEQ